MGPVHSKLKTLRFALAKLRELSQELDKLTERASRPPGLPVPNPTPSYWLQDPPYPELVDARSPDLPVRADIVIIGSGITAAAIARSVLQQPAAADSVNPTPSIVVLEARSLCSGATGRNGGHVKSSPHEVFAELTGKRGYSPERAAAITRFQLAHVACLTRLCEAEGWTLAECHEVLSVDVYLDCAARDKAFRQVEELRRWVPELEIETWDADAARKKFDVNQYAVGAVSYTAGAIWPFRFVSCVWRNLLNRFPHHLSLETGTPVTSVTAAGDDSAAYEVATSRGIIKCNHVVHATNAFATQFIEGLRGKMVGALAHMSAQRPGTMFPDYGGKRSWLIVYGDPAYDYVTQRPSFGTRTTAPGATPEPGDLMVGGGFTFGTGGGAADRIGVWDDSPGSMDALPLAHISAIMPTVFEPKWGRDHDDGRVKAAWTGIIGITGDFMPFVGRLDPKLTGRRPRKGRSITSKSYTAEKEGTEGGKNGVKVVQPGEWVAAGFCGEGMVWCWLSGTALGVMLAGCDEDDLPELPGRPAGRLADWFPKELMPSIERVKRVDLPSFIAENA